MFNPVFVEASAAGSPGGRWRNGLTGAGTTGEIVGTGATPEGAAPGTTGAGRTGEAVAGATGAWANTGWPSERDSSNEPAIGLCIFRKLCKRLFFGLTFVPLHRPIRKGNLRNFQSLEVVAAGISNHWKS